MKLSRRDLIRLALALPAAGLFSRYRALAGPSLNRVKITNIRAMAIPNHYIEGLAAGKPLEVRRGLLTVPTAPGLGLGINLDFLKKKLVEGEPFWG